ncbi:hypothetical protein ETC03_16580 [Geobacillus sp. MMMUD3]|nr:hypothetical protein [Geobacillus sp. MMMUD3]
MLVHREHLLGLFVSLLTFYRKGALFSIPFGFYWIINTPDINTIFLQKNKTRDKRELMQLINVVTSVSTLLFSFFAMYISLTVHLMLLINATLSLFIFVFFARIRGEDE